MPGKPSIPIGEYLQSYAWTTAEGTDKMQVIEVAAKCRIFWLSGWWDEKIRQWQLFYKPAHPKRKDAADVAIEVGKLAGDDLPSITRIWKVTQARRGEICARIAGSGSSDFHRPLQ